jgi:hypothetical protein
LSSCAAKSPAMPWPWLLLEYTGASKDKRMAPTGNDAVSSTAQPALQGQEPCRAGGCTVHCAECILVLGKGYCHDAGSKA